MRAVTKFRALRTRDWAALRAAEFSASRKIGNRATARFLKISLREILVALRGASCRLVQFISIASRSGFGALRDRVCVALRATEFSTSREDRASRDF